MSENYTLLTHQPDWDNVKKRFDAWWNRSSIGRPLMRIVTQRETPIGEIKELAPPPNDEFKHTNPEYNIDAFRNHLYTSKYMADAFPHTNINIGPGSMAVYLGSEPIFAPSTVWYSEVVEDWNDWKPLTFDPDNAWFQKHLEMIRRQHELANGEFLVDIPDIIENVDILSAMRGPQTFCYDLIDEPELMKELVGNIDDIYFDYYDAFYDIIKAEDGSSTFTAFNIWGSGKTAKVQCDFNALMNPQQFYDFVQPSLRKQCAQLDHSLFHLDGPETIIHLDALMAIDELDALQWTPGAGKPGGGDERWYPIYDKVRKADKSLWIYFEGKSFEDIVEQGDKIIKRYGPDGLYFIYHYNFTEEEGCRLVDHAEKHWSK